jgi:signal transduction histidine kinase
VFLAKNGQATEFNRATSTGREGPGMKRLVDIPQYRLVERLRRSVALRLYVVAFAFGCIATVSSTAPQLYRDHRTGVEFARAAAKLFAIQGAGIFSVALLVACAADRLIVRHLRVIALAARSGDYREAPRPSPLALARRRTTTLDELDRVVLALNALSTHLYCSHLIRDELEARVAQLATQLARAKDDLNAQTNERVRTRANQQELLESREKLREFGAYMEATREDERKRIALEIHDELGQLLTALKMDVSLLKMRLSAPDLLEKVADMHVLVDRTIWMVRNVANHLRPAALNFGLASALEWLAEDFARRNTIPCLFRMNGSEPVLPEAHATAVFRVVQESLTNVARHARASHVHVTLTRTERGFDLHVNDDGCGFEPETARNGYSYGLLSMSERARLIGASLRIDSAPGAGTTVSVNVPLHVGRLT